MTEDILGKPFDQSLQQLACRMGVAVKETAAPFPNAASSDQEGVLHVVRVSDGEWVVARFPVGLPRKE